MRTIRRTLKILNLYSYEFFNPLAMPCMGVF